MWLRDVGERNRRAQGSAAGVRARTRGALEAPAERITRWEFMDRSLSGTAPGRANVLASLARIAHRTMYPIHGQYVSANTSSSTIAAAVSTMPVRTKSFAAKVSVP